MAEVIHITENANQPEARVSALSLSELGVLIGNNLPTADPLTVGALWNDAGVVKASPTPIAITLLTSDTYKIGDVSKTFSDCYTTNYTPSDSATVAVVAGEGLSVDFIGGGTATSGSGTLTGTAALEAVINPEIGFTGVIDVTPTFSDPSERLYGVSSIYTINGPTGLGAFEIGLRYENSTLQIGIRDATSGTSVFIPVLSNIVSGQRYRMAYTFKPNLIMLSVNGGAAVSRVPNVTLDLTGIFIRLYVGIFSAVVGSSSRLGDARFYPLITNSDTLAQLSV